MSGNILSLSSKNQLLINKRYISSKSYDFIVTGRRELITKAIDLTPCRFLNAIKTKEDVVATLPQKYVNSLAISGTT